MVVTRLVVKSTDSLKPILRNLREDMKATKDIKHLRYLYGLERIVLQSILRDTNEDVGDYL